MFDKVILLNGMKDEGYVYNKLSTNIGPLFIEQALSDIGFNEVYHGPTKDYSWEEILDENGMPTEQGEEEIVKDLEAITNITENTLFGISLRTDDAGIFYILSDIIRKKFPRTKIAVGGPFVTRQNINLSNGDVVYDPIDIILGKADGYKYADFANLMHAKPFIDLINGVDFNTVTQNGLYVLKDGKIVGSGNGQIPSMSSLPILDMGEYERKKFIIKNLKLLLEEGCINGCDYCQIGKNGYVGPKDVLIKSLERVSGNSDFQDIFISGPNPLESIKKIEYLTEIFNQMFKDGYHPSIATLSIDPCIFSEGTENPLFYNFIDQMQVRGFFIGRETSSGYISNKIGRRYRGKVKTEHDLKREFEGIKKFITYLKKRSHKSRIQFSYILGNPFETKETFMQTLNEMKYFVDQTDDNLLIEINNNNLIPYPGTKLREKYVDDIHFLYDFSRYSTLGNVWKNEMGPGVLYMDHCPTIMAENGINPLFVVNYENSQHYFPIMEDVAKKCFADKLKPIPYDEKIPVTELSFAKN